MKVELKNIRMYRGHGDSHSYEASIYIDGKRVGSSSNDGWGGPDLIHIDDEAVNKRLQAYVKTLPPLEAYGHKMKMTDELLIGELLEEHLAKKEREKLIKKTKTHTVFRLKNDAPGSWQTLSGGYSPDAVKWIHKRFGAENVAEILNETVQNEK